MSKLSHTGTWKGMRQPGAGWALARFGILVVFIASLVAPAALGATVWAQSSITFDKTFNPDTIGPGSVSSLQFDITNVVSTPATDLAFSDTLPTGVTIATPGNASTNCGTATLAAPDGGSTITFSGGQVGGNSACWVRVDVTASASKTTTFTNTSGNLTSSAGNSGTASDDLTVTMGRPGFTKSFAPGSIFLGGRSTLTFAIDNSENENSAFALNFTDNLPTGLVVSDPANASHTCTDGGFTGGTLTAVPGTSEISLFSTNPTTGAAVGDESICTVDVDVTGVGAGQLHNLSGELTFEDDEVTFSSGKASATLEVLVVDLHLSKSFTDDPVPPGRTVTLEFTIVNLDRDQAATGVAFTDDLNATLSGLVATGLPSSNVCGAGSQLSGTSTLALTGGSLPAGGSCTFSVQLQVPGAAATGSYPNSTSAVTGTVGGSTVTGNAATETLYVSPGPILTKQFTDDPVGAGGDVTLHFEITNSSPSAPASGIEFLDDLTAFLPFPVSVVLPASGFCGAGSSLSLISLGTERQGLSLSGASLAAGASCSFDVTITIPAGMPDGTYPNTTSEITALVADTIATGRPATDDLVVVGGPTLTKVFTDDPVQPGHTVELEFTLSHGELAPGDATGISFTDDLAATLVGLTAPGQSMNNVCGSGNGTVSTSAGNTLLTFSGGSLAPGASCTFSLTLQVAASAESGRHTNTTSNVSATVAGKPVAGAPGEDNLWVAVLTLTKEFTDDPVLPNGTVTLEFTIKNQSSTATATSITFEDDLDDMLSGTTISTPMPKSNICGPGNGTLIGSAGNTVLTFVGGSLAPGASCTFSVTLQVPDEATSGQYNNATSDVEALLGGDPTVAPPATDQLTVVTVEPPGFNKSFTPNLIDKGATSTLRFTIDNIPSPKAANSLSFVDNLPSGVVVATPPKASTTCSGGTLTAVAGTGTISYSGGSVAAGSSCTVQADVASDADGAYVNTSDKLTSSLGDSGTASDTLFVGRGTPVRLGNFVWFDTDQDGIQDDGEPGVQGITVELHNNITCAGNQPIASDTTRANGRYRFTDVPPGNYCLQFSKIPAGWFITLRNQGGDDTVDSDANPTTGQIRKINLTADDNTRDMGLYAGYKVYLPLIARMWP